MMRPEGVAKTPWILIGEEEFFVALAGRLSSLRGMFRAVTGPGRSGAIAAVYASHHLSVPYLPAVLRPNPDLLPLLVIDTAVLTGKTLRRAERRARKIHGLPPDDLQIVAMAIYPDERAEGRVRFWYEAPARARAQATQESEKGPADA